jgi:hypothetical protein
MFEEIAHENVLLFCHIRLFGMLEPKIVKHID